jgi:hypothetical protein
MQRLSDKAIENAQLARWCQIGTNPAAPPKEKENTFITIPLDHSAHFMTQLKAIQDLQEAAKNYFLRSL